MSRVVTRRSAIIDGQEMEDLRASQGRDKPKGQPSIAKAKQVCHQWKMLGIQGFFWVGEL
jgi:hypothetical protein